MGRSLAYYVIEHPLIGEEVLEYDLRSRNVRCLAGRAEAQTAPEGHQDMLLFRLRPSGYKPLPHESEVPIIATLCAGEKNLEIFEHTDQFTMLEITAQKARETSGFYRK